MMNNFKFNRLDNLFAIHLLIYPAIFSAVTFFYSSGDQSLSSHLVQVLFLAVEFFSILLFSLIVFSFSKDFWRARLGILLLWLVCSIYYAQTFSVYISGGEINQVAIENTEDIQWINSPQLWGSLFFHVLYLSIVSFYFYKKELGLKAVYYPIMRRRRIVMLIISTVVIFFIDSSIAKSNEKLIVKSPLFSMAKAYTGFWVDNPPALFQKIYFDHFESDSKKGGLYPFETDAIQVQFSKNYDVDVQGSNVIVFLLKVYLQDLYRVTEINTLISRQI